MDQPEDGKEEKSTLSGIAEEEEDEGNSLRRSVTFHHVDDLNTFRSHRPVVVLMDTSAKRSNSEGGRVDLPAPERCRARSFLHEMGERIRLFPGVAGSQRGVPKSRSLHAFSRPDPGCTVHPREKCFSNTSNAHHSPHNFVVPVLDSPPDVPAHHVFEPRLQYTPPPPFSRPRILTTRVSLSSLNKCGKAMEEGLVCSAESQLGLLCPRCAVPPLAKSEIHSMTSTESLCTKLDDGSVDEPLCRICHCWLDDPMDPLISPCRCAGSLQYVHASCLMHWLDISSRKLHRPAICELCLYKYRRRRVLKLRDMKLPECSQRDFRCYSLFGFALLLMLLSALVTIFCFHLEKRLPPKTAESTSDREEMEAILSTITLVAAVMFFISFFLAMYAHVKKNWGLQSGLSFCNYVSLFWNSNLEWSVEEYRPSRDSQYLSKLEELRRKLNEKEKKPVCIDDSNEEQQPLRASELLE